jgi:hypothetical protein
MANVRRSDYENIVQVFNESGNKAALEYLQQNFGVKYPRDVITRIKKTPGYSYDPVTKKINISLSESEEAIFMGIDELCSPLSDNNAEAEFTVEIAADLNINIIYQELLQEKFLELTKYVKLNRYLNTINIDKSALIANGYHVFIQ